MIVKSTDWGRSTNDVGGSEESGERLPVEEDSDEENSTDEYEDEEDQADDLLDTDEMKERNTVRGVEERWQFISVRKM